MAIAAGELEREIRKFQEQFFPKIPPGVRETLERTTQDLVRSGIAKKSLHQGDQAPDFTLSNARGETVSLSSLVSQGPVVLAFYRGGW